MAGDDAPRRRFTVDEANAELPLLARRIGRLRVLRDEMQTHRERLAILWQRLEAGDAVLSAIGERQAAIDALRDEGESLIDAIDDLGVVLRDLDLGLVDFPAQVRGIPIYLCWRAGEPRIGFWHGREDGFAGRKPIETIGESPRAGPS
jgi:hypothetical protein